MAVDQVVSTVGILNKKLIFENSKLAVLYKVARKGEAGRTKSQSKRKVLKA